MLTTARDLWIKEATWQYWQLIRVLFFNFKVIGYISAFLLFLTCVFSLIGFIFPFYQILSVPIASLALFIIFFISVIMLPMGMLALVTNKHTYTIPAIPNKLFVVICFFCAFFSIVTPFSVHGMGGEKFSPNTAFSIFFVGALYFWLAIYLMHKSLFLFGLVPLILGVLVKFCASYLPLLHPLVLPLASVLSWGLFYRWWSAFRPGRTVVKSIFVESDAKKLQELPIEKWIHFSSKQVKTPVGTLLFGCGDGWLSLAKKNLMIYSVTLLFALFVCGGFKNWRFTENAFVAVLIALAYSFLISGIDFGGQRMVRNLRRCWLPFAGNRVDFFLYLERHFLRELGFLVLLNTGIICVFLWLGNHKEYFLYCLSGIVLFSIVLLANFYTNIYFYRRERLSYENLDLRKLGLNSIHFLPTIVYIVSKYRKPEVYEMTDFIVAGLVILMFACLKIARAQCIKQWQQVDF